MVKVVERGRFTIYVYDERGERHHRPHCHVRWRDGEARVALPTLERQAGAELPTLARRLVEDHVDDLTAAWNRLNPGRTIE